MLVDNLGGGRWNAVKEYFANRPDWLEGRMCGGTGVMWKRSGRLA